MKTLKILFLLVAVVCFSLQAQHTNTGATITIQSGCNVYAKAELLNSSGTINNNGNLHVTGHWTNNATINNSSTSSVYLDGTNQTIQGSAAATYYKLYLAGSTKTCTKDVTVQNYLDVGNSVMNTQNFVVNVTNAAYTAVDATTGYLRSTSSAGGLSRPTNSTNNYLYPVGTAGETQRKIVVTPEAAGSTFKVCAIDASAGGTYSFGSVVGSIGGFNTAYYHHVDRTSGSATANVSFYYATGDGGNPSYQGVARWNSTAWEEVASFPNTGTPQNWIIGTDISSFSPFVLFTSGSTLTVPTLSEWGLIILSLLTMTLVMLFIGKRELAVAGAGRLDSGLSSIIQSAPFSRALYFKVLSFCLLIAIAGFALVHVFLGTNGLLDLMGTVACSFIVAYMVYLYIEFDGFNGKA